MALVQLIYFALLIPLRNKDTVLYEAALYTPIIV